jgi:uncharacterized protein YggE
MQKLIIAIILAIIIFHMPIFAQDNNIAGNTLIVYGNGNIELPANRAQISFTVIGFGPTIHTAIQSTREKVSTVTEKLFGIGLSKSNLTTSSFNSGDNFEDKAFWLSLIHI